MCSTFSHIRQKAHSGKRTRTQHAWILKRAGLRHPSRDILLIPRASNRHKESHCAARATINCPCTRASPPLLPADQHGGALTFSLEVAVSVVLIKKLKGGGRRRSEREREKSVSNRELLRPNLRQRPPRVFSRAETMLEEPRHFERRVWREGKWSAFVSLLFFSFFLRSLFEVVGKFDALMSPFGNRTYDPEILLRAFRGYLEGYGNEGDYERGETETRRKIFKFLCVLSM